MATLTLSNTNDLTAPAKGMRLREWLGGQWAVLFSNPEDFAPHPSTPEGFITLLADDFAACGVKPISLADNRGTDAAGSWLDFAGADNTQVVLHDDAAGGSIVDLAAHTLATKLHRLAARFVIVLDEKARCRTTITYNDYSAGNSVGGRRTIADVLTVVQVLQRRVPAMASRYLNRTAAAG